MLVKKLLLGNVNQKMHSAIREIANTIEKSVFDDIADPREREAKPQKI